MFSQPFNSFFSSLRAGVIRVFMAVAESFRRFLERFIAPGIKPPGGRIPEDGRLPDDGLRPPPRE